MKHDNDNGLEYTEEWIPGETQGFKKVYLPWYKRIGEFIRDYKQYKTKIKRKKREKK